jgi:hypothetical protein
LPNDLRRIAPQRHIDVRPATCNSALGSRTLGTMDLEIIQGAEHVLTPDEKVEFAGVLVRWFARVDKRQDPKETSRPARATGRTIGEDT